MYYYFLDKFSKTANYNHLK